MFKVMRFLGLILATLPVTGLATDFKSFETKDFNAVTAQVLTLAKTESPKNVLVVFDIDNTLLATEGDLGSEHWFLWQRQLIEQGVTASPAVAYTVDDLLTFQGWIYKIGHMHPVAPQIPAQIRQLRSKGVSAIALTSRNLGIRDASIQEFQNNKIPLSSSAELRVPSLSTPFLPYDLAHLERSGLTKEDVENFDLEKPRLTIFDRGIFLTQGQHKGVMLKTLLARMQRKFTAIVFVDDRTSHIEGMRAAFANRPEKMVSIRFTKQEAAIEAFNKGDKHEAIAAWCKLSSGVESSILTPAERSRVILCP